MFTVPLNYFGTVLVCSAHGCPMEKIEWWRDGVPLSHEGGVISEPSGAWPSKDSISATLTWTRGFTLKDEGIYECVITHEHNNPNLPISSQNVEIKAGTSIYMDTEPKTLCSLHALNVHLVHFQIRVLDTNCLRWNKSQKEHIRVEFQKKLIDVVSRGCSCVTTDELLMERVPHCSILVKGASLFHGLIQTNSIGKTERIFCALHSWQQRSPLLVMDGKFQTVDNSCYVWHDDTNDEECAPLQMTNPERRNAGEIFKIVGVTTGFTMVAILFIAIIVCMGCYCHQKKRKPTPGSHDTTVDENVSTSRVDELEHIYDQ